MAEKHLYTNDLIKESSPYLLQHAHNPVNWEPWGEKALEKAKKENKLLIISIGYSACHWCHVMEHESFENEEVAKLMNTHFVSIKIDREERPDIDQVYMSAVQLLTGSGGWPLNCIALPNGKPIWGGTYFPKAQWMDALTQLAKLYEENPEKAEEYANNLTNQIKSGDLIKVQNNNIAFDKSTIDESITIWKKNIDLMYGGTNKAPKFPIPNNYQFLLRQAVTNKDDELLSYVKTTLDKIAFGGIYDQIGGGFSRYSTDKKWHIPHFEKMLYDNGQLVSLYSDAYLVTKNNLYKQKVYETLDFVKRELTTKEGAFYSSLDADSYNDEGHLEEGIYYAWKKEELKPLLKEDYKLFSDYYNINEYGLWEKDQYVLIRNRKDKEICKEYSISQNNLNKKIHEWKTLLLKKRSQRNTPRLDDKALTSWNGLMLKGYIDAYRVFNEDEFLKVALKNANFITHTQVKKDGGLYHNYKKGKSTINAHLEDYSIVIDAFTSLYEVTLDEKWLSEAKKLTDYTLQHFHDTKSSFFYFTSDMDESLITRKIDLYDNVIPSSNSMMARNLFKLSHYYSDKLYLDISSSMLKNMISTVNNYPSGYSNWLNLLSDFADNYYEIVVSGREASTKIKEINQYYIPNKLIAGSDRESALPLLEDRFDKHNTWVYLCVNNTCQAPEKEVKKALEKIK